MAAQGRGWEQAGTGAWHGSHIFRSAPLLKCHHVLRIPRKCLNIERNGGGKKFGDYRIVCLIYRLKLHGQGFIKYS